MGSSERPVAKPTVLVTRLVPGDWRDRLSLVADVVTWDEDRPIPRDILMERIGDVDALYCMLTDRVDAELLDAAPRLRAVATMSVGTDNIDLAECTLRGIPVGNTPDVLTETTADTAWLLMLASARRAGEGIDVVRDGEWGTWKPGFMLGSDVHGTTIGIVGLGRIGEAVARRAQGFSARVLYTARSRKPEAEARLGVAWRSLADLLAESDHVVLTVPLTPETRHLIDSAALRRMQPHATLINVSRGPIVDTDALVEALNEGWIGAAGLDVTDPEPIPPDHPLVGMVNCTILPHIGSASLQTRQAMANLAADDVVAALRGERMPACANPGVYEISRSEPRG